MKRRPVHAAARGLLLQRRMRASLVAAVCCLATLVATTARADDGATPPPPATTTQWYGWQGLIPDAMSAGLIAASGASDSDGGKVVLGVAGLSSFAFGAPIIHAAHGRWGIAALDLGVRAGSVGAGAAIGFGVGTATAPKCYPVFYAGTGYPGGGGGSGCGGTPAGGLLGALVGAGIGAVLASAFDATLLSRERVPAADTPPRSPALAWAPSVAISPAGGTAGVVGSF